MLFLVAKQLDFHLGSWISGPELIELAKLKRLRVIRAMKCDSADDGLLALCNGCADISSQQISADRNCSSQMSAAVDPRCLVAQGVAPVICGTCAEAAHTFPRTARARYAVSELQVKYLRSSAVQAWLPRITAAISARCRCLEAR